ncbi:MAG TPA: DNA gyrase inhibitor YacG [Steroidobacteraceae bacterium]|jgi:hypothetical protein|nr:DNA gyrase inhibitor YacG [Steroidobacteraceae bacterium]
MSRQFSCPTCARPIEWSDANPFRPFCSERCRLIDLGDWLTEKHVIPGESAAAGETGETGPAAEGGPTEDDDWPPAGGRRRI